MEIDEDERKREQRMEEMMEWMRQKEEEEGKGLYVEPEEDEDYDSDEDSYMRRERKRREAEAQEESEDIPEEERKARFEDFLEKTLPSAKKESAPTDFIDLGSLPESVRNSRNNLTRTISMSRLGSRSSSDGQPAVQKSKKTSSLIN